MQLRKSYPSDVTDAEWDLLEPLVPQSRGEKLGIGRPPVPRRELINGIRYVGQKWLCVAVDAS